MKRILSFLVVGFLLSLSNAYATDRTATFGDQNASGVYRLRAETDQSTGTNYGWVVFAQDTGIYLPYTTASTNQTLVAAQTGTTIVFNNGAGTAQNGTAFTLPTAAVGMEYTIVADVAKYFFVDAQGTDTINFSTATAGQRISNSASALAGDSITLFCATANKWSVKSKVGTWAVGPGQ